MEERSTYLAIIKSKTEIRKYVRIQVIGKDRVGKTSLVQRLLNLEDGAYNGKSTDGIEIDRKCQIRTTDGKWFVGDGKQRFFSFDVYQITHFIEFKRLLATVSCSKYIYP